MAFYVDISKAEKPLEDIYGGYRKYCRQDKGKISYKFELIKLAGIPVGSPPATIFLFKNRYIWELALERFPGDFARALITKKDQEGTPKIISSGDFKGVNSKSSILVQVVARRIISAQVIPNSYPSSSPISVDAYFGQEIHPIWITPGKWGLTERGLVIFDEYNRALRIFNKKNLQRKPYTEHMIERSYDCVFLGENIYRLPALPYIEVLDKGLRVVRVFLFPDKTYSCHQFIKIEDGAFIMLDIMGQIVKMTVSKGANRIKPLAYSSKLSFGHNYHVYSSGHYLLNGWGEETYEVRLGRLSLGGWHRLDEEDRNLLETIVMCLKKRAPAMPKPIMDEILAYV